jgi:peptidoglycan/LPS O-acetylase OafA/YrhL
MTSAPTSRGPAHRRDIQGLRAIAVLSVLAFHAGLPLPGGFTGVDVFFVISGFVITAMLVREAADGSRPPDLRRFYLRRLLRLLPALLAVLLVTLPIGSLLLSPFGPQQTAAATAVAALLLSANLQIAAAGLDYFSAPAALNPLLHTWSLAIEEQFYLVFPLLLAGSWAAARRFRRLTALPITVVSLLLVGSFSLMLLAGEAWPFGFYSPLTRAWEFALGALIALAAPQLQRLPTRLLRAAAWPAAGALLLANLLITDTVTFPGWWTLLPTGAAAVLIIVGLQPSASSVTVLLGSRLLGWIGDRSYALYLWHWPAVVFARLLLPDQPLAPLIATLLAVVPAELSFRLLEQPLRRRVDDARHILPRIIATAAAALLLGLLGSTVVADFWQARINASGLDRVAAAQRPLTLQDGCQIRMNQPPSDVTPCRWNTQAAGQPLYLIGDSNAGQFAPGLITAAQMLDRPLSALTAGNCAPVRQVSSAVLAQPHRERCNVYTAAAVSRLADEPAGTVVIAFSDRAWADILPQLSPAEQAAELQTLRDALQATLQQLQQSGHRVVLLQTIPQFFDDFSWDTDRCTLPQWLQQTCRGDAVLAAMQQRQSALRTVMHDVATATAAELVDFAPQICPTGRCLSETPQQIIYRDAGHLTNRFTATLAPIWIELLGSR